MLKEYIIKGFVLNDERFKTGNSMNYFNELQEHLREIRLSERFFYQKIKDIYTTSIDYNPKDPKTIEFFLIVQNKLLWAISNQTAAELIYRRVDASLPLLGMQSYDKKNNLAVRKSDVSIAKNYLNDYLERTFIQFVFRDFFKRIIGQFARKSASSTFQTPDNKEINYQLPGHLCDGYSLQKPYFAVSRWAFSVRCQYVFFL